MTTRQREGCSVFSAGHLLSHLTIDDPHTMLVLEHLTGKHNDQLLFLIRALSKAKLVYNHGASPRGYLRRDKPISMRMLFEAFGRPTAGFTTGFLDQPIEEVFRRQQ